jgi:hypothetical protein
LSFVRGCLFNIFAGTLHSWQPLLHPQPEDSPSRGDRDPSNMATLTLHILTEVVKCYSSWKALDSDICHRKWRTALIPTAFCFLDGHPLDSACGLHQSRFHQQNLRSVANENKCTEQGSGPVRPSTLATRQRVLFSLGRVFVWRHYILHHRQ